MKQRFCNTCGDFMVPVDWDEEGYPTEYQCMNPECDEDEE